jgi:hypothetical protein
MTHQVQRNQHGIATEVVKASPRVAATRIDLHDRVTDRGDEVSPMLHRGVTIGTALRTPTTMTFAKANNCQVYGGCDSPVVWCNVGGAHQSGNQVIAESAWTFWSTLK